MKKRIRYKENQYTIEIKCIDSRYYASIIGIADFKLIPYDCLSDMSKMKPYNKDLINANYDLQKKKKWDGILD